MGRGANVDSKDEYGFFLEPVDVRLVTDYLDVVKQPMDFGTMAKKLQAGEYTTYQQFRVSARDARLGRTVLSADATADLRPLPWPFRLAPRQDDVQLICDNCKKYNSKTTPYFKAAEKLERIAEKLFTKEARRLGARLASMHVRGGPPL